MVLRVQSALVMSASVSSPSDTSRPINTAGSAQARAASSFMAVRHDSRGVGGGPYARAVFVFAAALADALALAIGVAGLGGLVFTALRYRRDDTTAIVQQQSTILHDMQALNAELRVRVDELQVERDRLRGQIDRLGAAGS
jgi:hypothetical protein